jgi:hypothetical protein
MILAEARGRFLYEIRPDIMPYDHLTHDEIQLWLRHDADRKEQRTRTNG